MTISETLTAVKALIDTPEKWCQGQMQCGEARCVVGAFGSSGNRIEAFLFLANSIGTFSISDWNDNASRTHDQVMAAFDTAILEAKKKEAIK